MVKSMINHTNLLDSLLGQALKTTTYILNRVPTKAIAKALYELWIKKIPSIKHLHIWGSPAEVRSYRLNKKNQTQEQLIIILLDTQNNLEGTNFMIP